MITLAVKTQGTDEMFRRLAAIGRQPRELTMPAGRAVSNLLRRHYRERNSEPVNHFGAKTNFWLGVMRAVNNPEVIGDGASVRVSINHPVISHKFTGGTIRAKRKKNLAIPVSAEAYGRYPSVFEHETGLKLFGVQTAGAYVLAARGLKGASGKFVVHYILKPWVTQKADPDALPASDKMDEAAVTTMGRRLERLIERAKA